MARKKHISSHKVTGAGKAAKAGGKVSVATSKIAATVAAVAVTGAFGAGAYALSQDASAFNPDGFASAYGKGAQDSSKGYQATTEQTDAQANRHDDASQNKDKSAEANPSKDAFSELPNNGSGTTAVAVDSNATPGTSTVVNDGKGDGGSSNGSGENPSGPVIDNGGDDNGGGNNNGGSGDNTDTPGDNNNGGSPDTPSTPDTPNTPNHNGGNNNSGNGNGSGNSGTVSPDDKHEVPEIPDEIPDHTEIPSTPGEGSSYLDASEFKGSLNEDGSSSDISRVYVSEGLDYTFYRGQKNITEWMVFSTLAAQFRDNQGQIYVWAPTKEEYESGYDLFKIDKVYYIDDTENSWMEGYTPDPSHELSLPVDELPINASGLYITVKYRFSSSSPWLTYEDPIITNIDYGCTYVVGSDDSHTVLNTYKNLWPVLLSQNLDKVLPTIDGAVEWFTNEYGRDVFYQRKLLLSWYLDGEEVPSRYTPKLGKHVVTAGRTVDFDYEKYKVKPMSYWLDDDGHVDNDNGYNYTFLQTLVSASAQVDDGDQSKLEVPNGVEAVSLDQSLLGAESDRGLQVDLLSLPSTVKTVDLSSGSLKVRQQYVVDAGSSDLASFNGILTSKDGSTYLGVPLDTEELVIPEGVSKVDLSDDNEIKKISIEAKDYQDFPKLDWSKLSGCTIELEKSVVADFLVNNEDALDATQGNTIVIDGVAAGQMSVSYGMIISNGVLTQMANNEMEYVKLRGVKAIASGCFASNHDARVLILDGEGEYTFEEGCFDNDGNLGLVVCNTQEQKAAVESRLTSDGVEGVAVTLAARADGCSYFIDDAGQDSDGESSSAHAVLTSVSSDATHFDSDDLAEKLSAEGFALDTIAPFACEGNSSLVSVKLGQSISSVMTGAFMRCGNLEDVLIDSRETVSLGPDVFKSCSSMSVLASNASFLNVPGDFERPADSCMMYCLADNAWVYPDSFSYFNANPAIASYSLETIDAAGDVALYGCSASDSSDYPWLCIRAATTVSGEVSLPTTTTELFVGAFKYCRNSFSMNWSDLDRLRYIDDSAFYDSGVSGDVVVGDPNSEFLIDDSAFGKCGNLTSIAVNADSYSIGFNAFNSCTALAKVQLGVSGSTSEGTLYANAWNDCSSLESVEFKSSVAPGLIVTTPDKGFGFQLNASWAFDDEPSRFRLIVPDGAVQSYLEKWIYGFAGYLSYESAYTAAYNQCTLEAGNKRPDDAVVNERLGEMLLKSQNHLLRFFGQEESEKLLVTPMKGFVKQNAETPDGDDKLVLAPGADGAEDNPGGSTTEDSSDGKEETGTNNNGGAGAGSDASAGGETKESIGDDSGSKTDGAGGENAGGSNSGTVNGTEGGLDEPSGVTVE